MLNAMTNIRVTAVYCHNTPWPGLVTLPASVSLAPCLGSLCSNALCLSPALIDQIRLGKTLDIIKLTSPSLF